ncbi:MAG TPA: protein kinase [Polyangia bacterium]|nr:protein kinase [Polyangia bacterium]
MAFDARTSGPDDGVDPLIGQTIANYRVLARVGQGGMGAVYLAQHSVLGRHAAIKVLLPEFSNNRELVGRFLNEARATAQLRHPGFVEVFDSGALGNGSAYLVMEYLRGASLASAIDFRRTLTPNETLAILLSVAGSVAYAHQHGIIHRDLKPDNIFLAAASSEVRREKSARVSVRVLDFGIAKLTASAGGSGGSARTRTGSMLGTPLYMSPEQCRGAGHVDHRTDIYSLGCIAYDALTGHPPFPLEGFGEIISAHLNRVPAALRSFVPSLPEPLELFVLSLLEKDPAARPQTMDAVVAALEQLSAGVGEADLLTLIPPASLVAQLPSIVSQPGSQPRVATVPMPDSFAASEPTPRPAAQSGETRRLSAVGQRFGGPATFSTFAGASGEIGDGRSASQRDGRRGKRVGIALAAMVGIGTMVGLVVAFGWSGHPAPARRPQREAQIDIPEIEERPTSRSVEVARPAASGAPDPAALAGERPSAAEPAATVTVRFTSAPAGAMVVDTRTGRVVGMTPFEASIRRADRPLELILRKRGCNSKRVTVDLSRNTETTVTLDKRASAGAGTPDDSEDDRRKL